MQKAEYGITIHVYTYYDIGYKNATIDAVHLNCTHTLVIICEAFQGKSGLLAKEVDPSGPAGLFDSNNRMIFYGFF